MSAGLIADTLWLTSAAVAVLGAIALIMWEVGDDD